MDTKWVLEVLNQNLALIGEPELKFDALMCDAARGLIRGFKDFFGEELTIGMCWYHAKENVRKKAKVIIYFLAL